MLNKMFKKNSGFTMVEVLLAILILSIGVVGSYIVLQNIFAQTFISSNKLTAAYLAKEGFEIVRNIRDENWLNGRSFDEGLVWDPPSFFGCDSADYRYCEVDYTNSGLTSVNASSAPNPSKLMLDGNGYNLSSGDETQFSRKIEIESAGANSLNVVVTVYWHEKGDTRSIIVEGYLYDWR
jgi:prepilin-type N-terminal cleavage/methylation domain-containing protein